jgi:hypothetical protein
MYLASDACSMASTSTRLYVHTYHLCLGLARHLNPLSVYLKESRSYSALSAPDLKGILGAIISPQLCWLFT